MTINTNYSNPSSIISIPSPSQESATSSHITSIVKKIADAVQSASITIIVGAPGSGKSEQMEMALKNKSFEILDISALFKNSVLEKKFPEGALDKLTDFYSAYQKPEVKEEEAEWMRGNSSDIFEKYKNIPQEIIVIDEFDLSMAGNLNKDELKTALEVVNMSQKLINEANKKIFLILHRSGLESQELNKAINEINGNKDPETILTGYLNEEDQRKLLSNTSFTEEEKAQCIQWADGLPGAYLPILKMLKDGKSCQGITFETLKQKLSSILNIIYKDVLLKTEPESVHDVLNELISTSRLSLQNETLEEKNFIRQLLLTGFVNEENGELFMVPAIREFMEKQLNQQ